MIENCVVDLHVDYSGVWSAISNTSPPQHPSIFEYVRSLRRSLTKQRYRSLLHKVVAEVERVERTAVERSKLIFDPSKPATEFKRRGIDVIAFSLLGENALKMLVDFHGLNNVFDGFVHRVRVDQPPGILFPLRLVKRRFGEKANTALLICGDSGTIRSVREAGVKGVKTVALPVKPSDLRNIINAKPDIFLPTIYELVDVLQLGLV